VVAWLCYSVSYNIPDIVLRGEVGDKMVIVYLCVGVSGQPALEPVLYRGGCGCLVV